LPLATLPDLFYCRVSFCYLLGLVQAAKLCAKQITDKFQQPSRREYGAEVSQPKTAPGGCVEGGYKHATPNGVKKTELPVEITIHTVEMIVEKQKTN
jgi:hypothetical protein